MEEFGCLQNHLVSETVHILGGVRVDDGIISLKKLLSQYWEKCRKSNHGLIRLRISRQQLRFVGILSYFSAEGLIYSHLKGCCNLWIFKENHDDLFQLTSYKHTE
jgi:hypothetical protein